MRRGRPRRNVRVHRLLYLADVALAHASVEHEAGETQRHGFVVNMAWLFETLVARLLSDQQIRVGEQETFRSTRWTVWPFVRRSRLLRPERRHRRRGHQVSRRDHADPAGRRG